MNEDQLLQHVKGNRASLLSRLLTMVKFWIQSGSPQGSYGYGSFNRWAGIMGKILELSGVEGFLGNRSSMIDDGDAETRERRAVVSAWWAVNGGAPTSPKALSKICTDRELLEELLSATPFDEAKSAARMGYWLQKNKDRVVNVVTDEKRMRFYIRKQKKGNNPVYHLEQIEG